MAKETIVHLAMPLLLLVTLPAMDGGAAPISILEIIANPASHDGEYLVTAGYLHLEFEGDALYLHREDADNGSLPNGLRVLLSADGRKAALSLSNQYVAVLGTLRVRHTSNPWFRSELEATEVRPWHLGEQPKHASGCW